MRAYILIATLGFLAFDLSLSVFLGMIIDTGINAKPDPQPERLAELPEGKPIHVMQPSPWN